MPCLSGGNDASHSAEATARRGSSSFARHDIDMHSRSGMARNLNADNPIEKQDYAMELDETCIRNAAHLMVASLAGSLAHVTCKGLNIASELEQVVQLVTNDNLHLGCALIEQAATENKLYRKSKNTLLLDKVLKMALHVSSSNEACYTGENMA
ncbi:hypothetical protein LOK49_LG03G02534 [Camellia lanceoleosa]|uniref:Uncharacterized protein n=1 Tax=Camellia lanceoleosa TaxID=1840588 RepID=A0ACC0IG20_9ERIC|nr:hypothetical protein LOK49_LG03G02534 [Camellia lanceoleosa]